KLRKQKQVKLKSVCLRNSSRQLLDNIINKIQYSTTSSSLML
ncbi:MAG: hypothetical protein ACI9IZ_001249, partial [Nonlabens sp.]